MKLIIPTMIKMNLYFFEYFSIIIPMNIRAIPITRSVQPTRFIKTVIENVGFTIVITNMKILTIIAKIAVLYFITLPILFNFSFKNALEILPIPANKRAIDKRIIKVSTAVYEKIIVSIDNIIIINPTIVLIPIKILSFSIFYQTKDQGLII